MQRHRFEPVSLVFGLLFAGTGLAAMTGNIHLWRVDWSWFWPLALLVAGGGILLSLRSGSDPGDAAEPDERTRS